MIKIALIDEQKIFRDGLILNLKNENIIHLLEDDFFFEENSTVAKNKSEFHIIKTINTYRPDILIVDPFFCGRNRISLIKKIISHNNYLKIIIITGVMVEHHLFDALKIGVKAIMDKTVDYDKIMECIFWVHKGELILPEEIKKRRDNDKSSGYDLLASLNSIEYDVFRYLYKRKKIVEISFILNLSERTVYRYVKKIMCKDFLICSFYFFISLINSIIYL